jgi:hypothetical protein
VCNQRTIALRDPRVLLRLDLPTLEDVVTERVRAANAALQRRVIGEVREHAQGAGAAALGLSEVVGALARVSPVEGAAADGLADASGIAAVRRW